MLLKDLLSGVKKLQFNMDLLLRFRRLFSKGSIYLHLLEIRGPSVPLLGESVAEKLWHYSMFWVSEP